MGSIVTASGVSFEFSDGRSLFSDLQVSLSEGLTALVGPNGVGKTCLARLLAGELAPTRGVIRRQQPITVLAQREPAPRVSVTEHLATRAAWSVLGEALLDGIDRDTPCDRLSGGQWMRVRLACVLDDAFLVLDEPTNDLDRAARQLVLQLLRARRARGGALLISHDRECLALCDDVLELSSRGLTRFGGGWVAYTASRDQERARLAAELAQAKRQRAAVREAELAQHARQEQRDRRGAAQAARGGMPKILLGARKARAEASGGKRAAEARTRAEDAVREAHEAYRELKVDPVMYAELVGRPVATQKVVASARDFNVHVGRWLYPRDLSFTWRGGARVALRGASGSGKSTLLRALAGEALVTRGSFRGGDLTTLLLDQRLAQLDDDASVLANVRARASASEGEVRGALARFLFARDTVLQPVGTLSGGERLRAALAQGFLGASAPELLVLDEPTNNLDLANVEFLEGVVRAFRGALVVVSHDERFLEACDLNEVLEL